ncbi:hypothetical protein FHS18_005017 [Paenibacillus phyllosphaerae]|uniref:Uncharacterized protein n=1 Tax=Paenibacillus phyllosphaerae TaxID=274593 RepID=A0A7W5FPZ7_9BACL|nr:hypothetical protein [Paenibacillus phyllosphaerae]MBB3112915.1 hypothetical protein [Paenibacillus phyllosphaerae]
MIPFERAWPYDIQMKDIYVHSCPFCGQDNVLLPLRPSELKDIRTGKKRLLVFPCCHGRVTVLDADEDYLLTDTRLRK